MVTGSHRAQRGQGTRPRSHSRFRWSWSVEPALSWHPSPRPRLTQLGALLWGDGLLAVGLIGHRAGDAALAPPLAVGSFAAFGGHRLLLIVVLPRGVVRLLPEGQRGRQGWLHCMAGQATRAASAAGRHLPLCSPPGRCELTAPRPRSPHKGQAASAPHGRLTHSPLRGGVGWPPRARPCHTPQREGLSAACTGARSHVAPGDVASRDPTYPAGLTQAEPGMWGRPGPQYPEPGPSQKPTR